MISTYQRFNTSNSALGIELYKKLYQSCSFLSNEVSDEINLFFMDHNRERFNKIFGLLSSELKAMRKIVKPKIDSTLSNTSSMDRIENLLSDFFAPLKYITVLSISVIAIIIFVIVVKNQQNPLHIILTTLSAASIFLGITILLA